MSTLCYSVRLESLVRISHKALLAIAFDGSQDIIPASQVFGRDYGVMKSDAWWISAWILEKKSIQYSSKKQAWFDENGHMMPTYTIERHTPEKKEAKESNEIKSLKR
jgi:hypothetical protein